MLSLAVLDVFYDITKDIIAIEALMLKKQQVR